MSTERESITITITNAADLHFGDGYPYPYKVTDNPANNFLRKDIIASLQRALITEHDWTAADAAEASEGGNVYCLDPTGIYAIDDVANGGHWVVDHYRIENDWDTGSEILDPANREELSEFLSKL